MYPLFKYFPFLVFVFFAWDYSAQTLGFNFQKYDSEQGLNGSNVFSIKQAPNGLIYLATQQGIHYFDGYKFTRIKTERIKSTDIRNIELKGNSTLQMITRNALLINYNLTKKSIADTQKINYTKPIDEIVLTQDYLYGLNDEIEIGCLHLPTNTFTEDAVHKKTRLNQAHCLFKTKSGRVLVGRSDGLYELTKTEQIRLPEFKNIAIHAIAETKEGNLVLGTSNKILIVKDKKIINEITPNYKTKSNTFSLFGERNINKLLVDKSGKIWFTAFPNENIYVYANNQVLDVNEILNITPSLINTIFSDQQDNIWVGTFNDGLYFIQNPEFNNTLIQYNQKTLPVNAISIKGNLIFAATQNGLYALNNNTGLVKTISKPDDVFKEQVNDIRYHNGIYYYSKSSAFDIAPSILIENKNSYKLKPIVSRLFYPISENQAVIADYMANVLLVDLKTQQVKDTLISFSDYKIGINDIYLDKTILFLATSSGLITYDLTQHKQITNSLSTSDAIFYAICKYNDDLLISSDNGLHIYKAGKLLKNLETIQLSTIKKIKNHANKIWLITNNGILITDTNLKPLSIINKANGLLSNVVNDISFDEDAIAIANNQCVTLIPANLLDSISPALKSVEIQKIEIDGESFTYEFDKILNINTSQKDIAIYFSSPFFSNPNKQYFKYRLDDSKWNELDNAQIFLNALAGGNHRIEITASYDNIKWSPVSVVLLKKEIKFSETVWVYWMAIIGGLLVIGTISYIWIKRVKRKALKKIQTEQQVNLLKHQAMNSLLSPHFIFNSLTSIQNYINTNNSLKASEYLAKFSRLIRMIIEKASQSEISLTDEVARLSYYLELEKERFKDKFDYFIEVDEQLNRDLVKIPNMIIQPHAENSIIHGILPKQSHGTLYVRFKKVSDTKLLIQLEDDGIGIEKAKLHAKTGHKSLGTSTIQNILELNKKLSGKNQSVSMIDKSTLNPPQEGTLITIELEF
jgi:ligand-binding sensor domain-containing protein